MAIMLRSAMIVLLTAEERVAAGQVLAKPGIASLLTSYPSFARPNGKIAFSSQRDGNPEIYVMDQDGTNPTRFTRSNSDCGQ